MGEPRTVRSVGVTGPGRCEILEYVEEPPADGEIRLDTVYSGLSAGTELTFVKGTNPYLSSRWDAESGVFVRGEPSQSLPMLALGYMEVARVVESRSPDHEEGELIGIAYGHRTGHVVDARAKFHVRCPPALDPVLGIYLAQMGPICANGVLHAAAELAGTSDGVRLGDGVRDRRVLVTGAGVVGLLTGLFARIHGAAEVAVADPDPTRLAAAAGLGLVPVADEDEDAVWRWCKSQWDGGPGDRGADVVFQCRGRSSALATALRCLRPQGTVIDLAFYQGGADDLRLGEEFHHNGLTVRCAQIGRVPRGLEQAWDRHRLAVETCDLLAEHGRLVREHMVTDLVPFDEAPRFITELAERQRSTIQAVFVMDGGAEEGRAR